jgi:hypothetical protein
LLLKVSIDVVRVLAFQDGVFRGRDESASSTNRENFLEILDFTISYNEKFTKVTTKAPKNTTYTSPMKQKQILHFFSTKVKKVIRDEIGSAKFYLIIDEACDESMNEQMVIVLRFVDKNDFVRKRFFELVHVSDTTTLTLKNVYILYYLNINLTCKIFEGMNMMVQVICDGGGMSCKLWFQMIVHMPITFITSHIIRNWH